MKRFLKATALCCVLAIVLSMTVFAAGTQNASLSLRIEGVKATVYSGTVNFTPGEDFYDIMSAALAAKNIPIVATDGDYGHEITSIGGESGEYPLWWHLYVNDASSDVGVDDYLPKSGDAVVFYLGDDSVVHYPTVTVSPKYPVAGQPATINVSAAYTDYSDYNNPVDKDVMISGATVTLSGKTYQTDANGNAAITMPSAGSYTFRVAKETADATPAIVRTGDIPLTVYTAQTVPTGGASGSGGSSTSAPVTVSAAKVAAAVTAGAAYVKAGGSPDWGAALALEAAGQSVPRSFAGTMKDDVASYGNSITPTHLAGDIIGLKAAGLDPRNFDGQNLVAKLYGSADIGKTGLNGYTYTLLALDSGNYSLPANAAVTRSALIADILSYQLSGGAFALDKNSPADSDMTAIAVTALAPYLNQSKVKAAVDSAAAYLSKAEKADGGFVAAYSTNETSETVSQVIIALTSVGINPATDTRFDKNGASPLSNLLSYKTSAGFAHVTSGATDLIATEQAVQALSSYEMLSSGARLYDLTKTSASTGATSPEQPNPNTGDAGAAPYVVLTVTALAAVVVLRKRK